MNMTAPISLSRRALGHAVTHIKDRELVLSSVFSILLLCASLFVSYYASLYAAKSASNYVTDIVLSNIPVVNVEAIFMYGPFVMWIVVAGLLLYRPGYIPFTLKSISFFILVRSVFITLTHLGPFPTHPILDHESIVRFFTSDSDLFFSAHTGLPFLMALVFWKSPRWRYIFLATSIFFGAIVLLGHFHYTIDVAGAFFITHGIYRLSELAFTRDKKRFDRYVNNSPREV
jgi:hypothetical protein